MPKYESTKSLPVSQKPLWSTLLISPAGKMFLVGTNEPKESFKIKRAGNRVHCGKGIR